MTKKFDMLMMIIARDVQCVEALSNKWFSRMAELRSTLPPRYATMLLRFYNNGYFLPDGADYAAFVKEVKNTLDIDLEGDQCHSPQVFKRVMKEAIGLGADESLLKAAKAYFDSFKG